MPERSHYRSKAKLGSRKRTATKAVWQSRCHLTAPGRDPDRAAAWAPIMKPSGSFVRCERSPQVRAGRHAGASAVCRSKPAAAKYRAHISGGAGVAFILFELAGPAYFEDLTLQLFGRSPAAAGARSMRLREHHRKLPEALSAWPVVRRSCQTPSMCRCECALSASPEPQSEHGRRAMSSAIPSSCYPAIVVSATITPVEGDAARRG
jgi:hypothetical protein